MSLASLHRVDELEADRALWGLSVEEQSELQAALTASGRTEDRSWELSCAALTAALLEEESLPSQRLIDNLCAAAPVNLRRAPPRGVGPVTWLLAAATVALSVLLWQARPATRPSLEEQRQALLAGKGAVVVAWGAGGLSGDVVWDGAARRGFLRFENLPANDPKAQQYQLWILDARRDPAHPVDGGVFDVPRGAKEVVVPIDPKILVHEAQAFVVTVEEPGGVVVSKREQVVALAEVR